MKNIISIIITIFALSFSATGFAQSEDVISGFSSGNVDLIAKHFSNEVWLCLGSQEDEYSATNAKKQLSQFLSKNSVKSFSKLHDSGKSNAKTEVLVGKLMTSTGEYRVHVYINKGKNPKIDELRIVAP